MGRYYPEMGGKANPDGGVSPKCGSTTPDGEAQSQVQPKKGRYNLRHNLRWEGTAPGTPQMGGGVHTPDGGGRTPQMGGGC
mmetsp:Transcript_14515/g.28720  ORF Transcript_14515/g.28720 Transcript_14515/m.28720 type:complete len:81 (+) Transcript_14515:220-462(+)